MRKLFLSLALAAGLLSAQNNHAVINLLPSTTSDPSTTPGACLQYYSPIAALTLQLNTSAVPVRLWMCDSNGTWQRLLSLTNLPPFTLSGVAAALGTGIAGSRGACAAVAYYLATDTHALTYCDGFNWSPTLNPSGSQACIFNSTADNFQCYDSAGALTIASGGGATLTGHTISAPLICADTSGSATAQACTTSPTFTPVTGDTILYTTTTNNSGALTLSVNGAAAAPVVKGNFGTALNPNDVEEFMFTLMTYAQGDWNVSSAWNLPLYSATDIGNAMTCTDGSGSPTAQSCITTPLLTSILVQYPTIAYQTTTSNTGDLTINVDGLGAKHVRKNMGTAVLVAGDMPANVRNLLTWDGNYWEMQGPGTAPTGGGGGSSLKGTATLGTALIASGACATTVTVTAAGAQSTDTVSASFASDPTSTTGYISPSVLTVMGFPTAGNANFKVCNNTSSALTPGAALTVNWAIGARTVASGTAALGTSLIAAGACATVVSSANAAILTSSTITASFNVDPTSTTGYIPGAMLSIVAYPTAGDANFKVCNNSTAGITPSAVTLNWQAY